MCCARSCARALAQDARELRVLASPPVYDLLQEEESAGSRTCRMLIKKPVSVQVEASLSQEQYDIVLL
jgi:ribonuclease G